ncbi:tRNA N6-adenosine threonylcarbamoyltransferase, partial [Dissostichus eleginoides]
HQKHAVDWVVCSCTGPHNKPRMSNIASRHHKETAAICLALALAWHGTARPYVVDTVSVMLVKTAPMVGCLISQNHDV